MFAHEVLRAPRLPRPGATKDLEELESAIMRLTGRSIAARKSATCLFLPRAQEESIC